MTPNPKAPQPLDVAAGLAVRARRMAAGMSQETLAQAIGVTFQQVQKYERGTNRISASRLGAIAAALGCEVADLLSPTGDAAPRGDSAVARFAATREFGRVAEIFDRVPDAARRRRVATVLELLLSPIPSEAA